jgi:hypothetical protein
MAQHPVVDQGLLIFDASRLHSDTPQSVGLLWTIGQPVAGNPSSQYTAFNPFVAGIFF